MSVFATFILVAFGEFTRSALLGLVSWYTLLPVGFLWLLAFDTMTRDAVEPVKMVVMAVVEAGVIFTSILTHDPAPVINAYGEPFFMSIGLFGAMCYLWLALNKVIQTYFLIKIYRHVPQKMRGLASTLSLASGHPP